MNSTTLSPLAGRAVIMVGLTTAALVAGLRTGGTGWLPSHPPRPTAAVADTQQQVRKEVGTFSKLAKSLKPSVVNIAVEKVAQRPGSPLDAFPELFRLPERHSTPQFEPRSKGQGSGVIITADGYILTNNHVVSGADEVKVTLSDGQEMQARVIGCDPKTDLALVKVAGSKLPAATMGDSDALEVGDWVMAIGNPFGLEATVTVGVLSGKGRVIGAGPYDDFLQTDASINPGNSGGPLFNTDGQVVGINTAIIPNGQGIGFSIPVNLAKDIVEQLKTSGHVVRGFLGLGVQPLTPKLKSALKLPAETKGALVSQVIARGPAGGAGVKIQDVVIAINGRPVTSDREMLAQAARLPVGRPAELKLLREGREMTITVGVTERPDDQVSRNELKTAPVKQPQDALGMGLQPLSAEAADQLRTDNLKGVVVSEVVRNSPAQRAGLQPGDIIRKVNDRDIESLDDFLKVLEKEKKSQALAFLVERQGGTRFVLIES